MSPLRKFLQAYSPTQVALLVFLIALGGVGAAPHYVTGRWPWEKYPLSVPGLNEWKGLADTPLAVEGWNTLEHGTVDVNGKEWIAQSLGATTPKDGDLPANAILLMLPQRGPTPNDRPQVEWTDLSGWKQNPNQEGEWKSDSHRSFPFTVEVPPEIPNLDRLPVKARLFRGWTPQQTYLVVQWYAWNAGGSADPGDWFWQDWWAQLRGDRVPWIAVHLMVPIAPLDDDLEQYMPVVTSLAQSVQLALTEKHMLRGK